MKKTLLAIVAIAAIAAAFLAVAGPAGESRTLGRTADEPSTATFAGGCFWCTEADFEKVDGVIEAVSGFTGGREENPTYKQVASGRTSHIESVVVTYDPARVSYARLLEIFWTHIDPTDAGGQFVDRGHQYTTAIFYHDEAQKRAAEGSREKLAASGVFDKPIVTAIRAAGPFYRAEEGHQDYYRNHSLSYRFYRYGSGRDQFLERTWRGRSFRLTDISADPAKGRPKGASFMKPDKQTLRGKLNEMQYRVTQEDATEPPFRNDYWDNKAEGIYVDVVSGEPLFSSTAKFDSGTGWPSFFQPIDRGHVVEKTDRTFFMTRTEVRSAQGDSHLGHVFPDGPAPTGLRYCINSAALRFIPKEAMAEEGYSELLALFDREQQ